MAATVYFSKLEKGERIRDCLNRLMVSIDPFLTSFGKGSFVGIKMTIGDQGSTGYIKPELVGMLVKKLKKQGAKPFVFDTNVIYHGKRQNAVDHLNLAYQKGFTPGKIGCPYIIADSVFGTDSISVKADYKNIRQIKVPSLIKMLDDVIVLSHVTGHLMSGFAGSIKNVAMGMSSRAGKQIQHSSIKPMINVDTCTMCGACIEVCPVSAISELSTNAYINSEICVGCAECIAACKIQAVHINWNEDPHVFAERMSEYAMGILSRIRRKIFLNFATDITLECDCICGDDQRIVDDTGIFASEDILAVDKSCFDVLTGSRDLFSRGGKISAHKHQFEYAEAIGLGKTDYKLVTI
ncbi:MAG: DUF362 domain-containing protein [Nitrospiraceae bacterium]|nr:MAG: DUF362 domain-containing protein [Nitrospiraceae bacterium]